MTHLHESRGKKIGYTRGSEPFCQLGAGFLFQAAETQQTLCSPLLLHSPPLEIQSQQCIATGGQAPRLPTAISPVVPLTEL